MKSAEDKLFNVEGLILGKRETNNRKRILTIEQTRGFTLAQGEDEMFIAAKGGAGLQRSWG